MDGEAQPLRRVVLVANRKGGVGKTALCRSVASEAASLGLRVAVLDGDSQGDLSRTDFGIGGDEGRSLAMAMQYGTPLEPVTSEEGIDVIVGGKHLMGAIGAASSGAGISLEAGLRDSLSKLCQEREYDLVLIDSGPGDTPLVTAYMSVARWLIVPAQIDDRSLSGVGRIGSRYVEAVRNGADINLLGGVLMKVNPQASARNKVVLEELSVVLGGAAEPFETTIRHQQANDFDASRNGLSVRQVADQSKTRKKQLLQALKAGAKVEARGSDSTWWSGSSGASLADDYARLTGEILHRIETKEAQL